MTKTKSSRRQYELQLNYLDRIGPADAQNITPNDRLSMTIFFALALHGILILGITFSMSPPATSKTPPALDVILVQTSSPEKSDKAKYLAQVSQLGGGNSEEKVRPTDVFSAPTLSQQSGLATQSSQAQTKTSRQKKQLAMLSVNKSSHAIPLQKKSKSKTRESQNTVKTPARNATAARMAAELSLSIQKYSSRPREKFINSSTREFTPAKYMRQWIDRVERIGNLNYPDEAKRNKLSGTLVMDVVIDSNGELLKSDIRRSSGHKLLDDAAKRIVRLASPYSAFPAKLRREADVIHITRSWSFISSKLVTN